MSPQGLVAQPEKAIFTFRPKSWVSGMPHEEEGQSMRIRRDIECLSLADSRKWAGGYIADNVPASFTRSDPDGGQSTHQVGCIIDMEVVKLDVLPCRNVGDAVGIFLR